MKEELKEHKAEKHILGESGLLMLNGNEDAHGEREEEGESMRAGWMSDRRQASWGQAQTEDLEDH